MIKKLTLVYHPFGMLVPRPLTTIADRKHDDMILPLLFTTKNDNKCKEN